MGTQVVRTILAVALLGTIPSAAAQTVTSVEACRVDRNGSVAVFGRTSFRDGTILMVRALSREMPAEVINGAFGSAHFADNGDLAAARTAEVRIGADLPAGRHRDTTFQVTLAPFLPLYPPTLSNLVILPLPAPALDKAYALDAKFAVDSLGRATLLEWTRPHDRVWGQKVRKTLLANLFRPALHMDGTPTCALGVIRSRVRVQ